MSTPPLVGVAYGGVWGWCRGRHRAVEQCRHLEACRRAGAGGAVGDGGVVCCVVARARAKASRAGPGVAVVADARRLVERTRALELALPAGGAESRVVGGRERAARGASPWSRGSALPCKAGPGGRRRHVTSAVGWRKASLREADRSFAVAATGWHRHVVGGARGGAADGAAGVMSFLRCARMLSSPPRGGRRRVVVWVGWCRWRHRSIDVEGLATRGRVVGRRRRHGGERRDGGSAVGGVAVKALSWVLQRGAA